MQYSVLPTVNNLGLLFYVTALQKMKTDHPSSSTTRGGLDKLQTLSSSTPISSKGKAAQEHYEDGSHCLATAAGTRLLPSYLWTTCSFFSSKSHSTHTGIIILQRVCACPGDSLSLILVVWKCIFGHITNIPGLPGEQCAATPQNTSCASDQGLWRDMTAAWHLTQPTPSLLTQDYRSVHPFLGAMCILATREKYFWSCDGKGTARSLRKSDQDRWTCQTCQTLSAGHRMNSQLRILYNNFPQATYLNENPWELLSWTVKLNLLRCN